MFIGHAISGHTNIITDYDSNACPSEMKCRRGNITSKTDAGTYAYTNAKINAVTQINPSAGNISSSSQSLPTDTSFLQPAYITEGICNLLTYTYGSDENRIKAVQTGTTTNTRYYFGDYEKRHHRRNYKTHWLS